MRPEVRYLSDGPLDVKMGYRETYAPGDALLERMESMWIVKVASVPRICWEMLGLLHSRSGT